MARPLQKFVFRDFRGGLNTKDGPFELHDNEAQDLLNVTLTQRGALAKRKGLVRFDASGYPASLITQHLRSWYPGTSKFLMASIGGDVYSFTTAGAGTQRINGTLGTSWCMEQMQDVTNVEQLWCCNGVDTPRKITGGFTVANWTDPAATASILRVWKNRMVVSAGAFGAASIQMRIDFSAIGDPETFGALDFVIVKGSDEDAEPITWLEVLGDDLIVFKRNSVWKVYSEPPNIALQRLGAPGCEDRFQTCVVGGRVYFWSRSGVWSTDGIDAPKYESESIENFIADHHDFTKSSEVRLCASRDRRVFVSLALTGSTGNNHLLELVTPIKTGREGKVSPWLRHDIPVSAMCTFRPAETDVIVGGAGNDDRLWTLFTGLDDDGEAIESFWWSSWKALFGEEPLERLRRVNLQMDGTATVQVYRDFEEVPSFTDDVVTPGADDELWDGGLWDGGLWESAGTAGFERVRPETLARYHSVRVHNVDAEKPMNIYSVELRVRGQKELHT